MAAPIGNQFWKLRSKHGRDKIFKTPEILWEAACEYFEWCDSNPLIAVDYKGKDATQVKIPKMRAYTIHGLVMYLDVNLSYWRDFKAANHKDFNAVISRIEEIIFRQKFEGAAAEMLNASIIARDLGLVDKKDVAIPSVNITYKVQSSADVDGLGQLDERTNNNG